jgi:hypothetical protein
MTADAAGPNLSRMRIWFDPALAGVRVQADGGAEIADLGVASRETYEGTLTGRRLEHGDPPSRWLEIGQLTDKPEDFAHQLVWCDESFVYVMEGGAGMIEDEG